MRPLRAAASAHAGPDPTHDVAKQLRAINAVSLGIVNEARTSNNPTIALKAIDRIQRQLELQAKLLGDLEAQPVTNIMVSPEWLSVRGILLAALAPYPEARTAVVQRLLTLESPNGQRRSG